MTGRMIQGPILGCAFGYSIRDRNLFVNGFLNEIFALVWTICRNAFVELNG